jgi:hypothetical protein
MCRPVRVVVLVTQGMQSHHSLDGGSAHYLTTFCRLGLGVCLNVRLGTELEPLWLAGCAIALRGKREPERIGRAWDNLHSLDVEQ